MVGTTKKLTKTAGSASTAPDNLNGTPPKKTPGRKAPTKNTVYIPLPCNICNENIGDSQALECDLCHGWSHQTCSDVSLTQYNFLTDCPSSSIKWFCKDCNSSPLMKKSKLEEKYEAQDKKLDDLSRLVIAIESQTQIMSQLLQKGTGSSTESSETSVKATVSEVLDEQRERDEKKDNIIIFNIPESQSDDDDVAHVREVITHVCPGSDTEQLAKSVVSRIGTKKDDPSARPRPIKVTITHFELRQKLLRGAKKLKSFTRFQKVGLTHDKTKREILKDRDLRAQVKKMKEDGKDAVIYQGKAMERSERETLKNAGRGSQGGPGDTALKSAEEPAH